MASDDAADSRCGKREFSLHGGYLFPSLTTEEWINDVTTNFKPRESDIFVISFPKSGTNWICHIIEILKTGKPLDGALEKSNIDLDIPQIEALTEEIVAKFGDYSKRIPIRCEVESLPPPRVFFTHLPHEYIPKHPSAKYVYIYRNPKDILVSAYHHLSGMKIPEYTGTLQQFFNLYTDTSALGYFRHVRGHIEPRGELNKFVLSYEELKTQFRQKVKELSHFLGFQINEETLDLVAKETSFDAMRNNALANRDSMMRAGLRFLRRGAVGNWKRELSPEQSRMIDEMTRDNLSEEFINTYLVYE